MMESAISSLGIKTLEKRFPKGDVLIDLYSYLINRARRWSCTSKQTTRTSASTATR